MATELDTVCAGKINLEENGEGKCVIWKIGDFDKLVSKLELFESIDSEVFGIAKRDGSLTKWQMRLYPNGKAQIAKEKSTPNMVSLHLRLVEPRQAIVASVQFFCVIGNARFGTKTYYEKFVVTDFFGEDFLVKTEDMLKPENAVNGKVIFGVEIAIHENVNKL